MANTGRIDIHWTPAQTKEQGVVAFDLPELSADRQYTVEVRLFGPSKKGPQYRVSSKPLPPKGKENDA